MSAKPGELENILGYRFKDVTILERALTHRSWAYERMSPNDGNPEQNETLEFLGDSVLGLAIAEQVFIKNPSSSEGEMTLMKHRLVSSDSLAAVASEIGLGRFVRLGKGEERSGGRERKTILTNTLEAVIGAVFSDGGFIAARSVIVRLFADKLRRVTPESALDFKTILQETLHASKSDPPVYTVVRTEGPSHNRRFFVEAVWDKGKAEGNGRSIKSAEMEAAAAALELLRSKKGIET
ncbi:MAG: ribonuclease III [Acidobacteria bacterium]|nr:MAG: ribonuclease III [Acidobacteriota bacterium]REK03942.1 MAG: ribonuclease III [Acidobacteriota bacterium]REK15104.1 MAG: ribonuclease III [Acidobacteriota bacterium]REK46194.1 MAG: ribonuclease III [Acidobacteriota bacterium]